MYQVNLETARAVFVNHRKIICSFSFGSGKNGIIKENSDLDIAILFYHSPDVTCLASLRSDLQKRLCFENIDLVVLNTASTILAFEAVSGNCLYVSNPARKAEFVSLVAREYEDEMANLEHQYQLLRKR